MVYPSWGNGCIYLCSNLCVFNPFGDLCVPQVGTSMSLNTQTINHAAMELTAHYAKSLNILFWLLLGWDFLRMFVL
jgi:hypothetical protein